MTQAFTSKSIIDYGKSQGYSNSDIKKALDNAKYSIVDYGINAGYKGSEINNALKNAGYTGYNPLKAKANWKNLGGNIARNAREFARDMRTIGGVVIQPFVDVQTAQPGDKLAKAKESFINAINNDALRRTAKYAGVGALAGSKVGPIGIAGGALTGGLLGLLGPKGFTNAMLQPYETSTKDIGQAIQGNKSWGDIATDILQGGMRNPLYSGLDVLSAGGAKALGGAGRAIGKAVPSSAPMWLQEIIPSPGLRDFSRAGTNAFQGAKARASEYIEPLEKLSAKFGINNEDLVRNIIANEGNLTGEQLGIAKAIKKSIRDLEGKTSEYGFLDKANSKSNVVAQYGMYKLMNDIPDVLHQDLVKYIDSGEMTPRIAEAVTKNPELYTKLNDVIDEGKKLYDNGDIAWLSQALVGTTDPRGEVIARASAKLGNGYFGTRREIGRATVPEQAKMVEDSLAYQQGQSLKAIEAIDVVDELLKQPGLAEEIKDLKNIPKGKTIVNPNALRKGLRDAIQEGSNIDVANILKNSDVPEVGAYMINNVYFKALENMFKPIGKGTGTDVLSAFKKTVLASPHWIALNRIGNWTNNSMGGVKLSDGIDAVRNMKLMPKQLKTQTSFGSYVGDTALGFSGTFTTPAKKLIKELKKFGESEKGLSDIGRVAGQLFSNTNNIFANPMFRIESIMEAVDRYSNFIRQAKREAKATGKDWKTIVKKSNTDDKLFNKLNTQVNKDLGDYVGRNYLLPNWSYQLLREGVPFYRFLTQTGRTSFHQLANHPLAFQSTVMAPAKAGRQFSEDIIRRYGLDPEEYEGGVPYSQQDSGMRYVGTEPLPAGAVLSDLIGSGSKLNLLSPYFSTLPNLLAYKKGDLAGDSWLPTSPGLTEYKMAKGTTKGYEPTDAERRGYALTQALNTIYAPTRMTTGWARELANTLRGKPTLSLYDTTLKANPLSYAKELPIETLGKWFGIQNRPYFPQYIERPRKPKKSELRNMYKYRQQYKRNTEG